MLRNILSVVLVAVLLSLPAFAKNVQKANLMADMECGGCKNKIEKALKSTKGVEKVNINLSSQSVKVEYDKDVVSQDDLIKTINTADAKYNARACSMESKDTKSAGKKCDKPCQSGESKDGEHPCKMGNK